jgi:hypothetical protein
MLMVAALVAGLGVVDWPSGPESCGRDAPPSEGVLCTWSRRAAAAEDAILIAHSQTARGQRPDPSEGALRTASHRDGTLRIQSRPLPVSGAPFWEVDRDVRPFKIFRAARHRVDVHPALATAEKYSEMTSRPLFVHSAFPLTDKDEPIVDFARFDKDLMAKYEVPEPLHQRRRRLPEHLDDDDGIVRLNSSTGAVDSCRRLADDCGTSMHQ